MVWCLTWWNGCWRMWPRPNLRYHCSICLEDWGKWNRTSAEKVTCPSQDWNQAPTKCKTEVSLFEPLPSVCTILNEISWTATYSYPRFTSYPDIHKTTLELYVHYVFYTAWFCLHGKQKTKSQIWESMNDTGFVYLTEKLTYFCCIVTESSNTVFTLNLQVIWH